MKDSDKSHGERIMKAMIRELLFNGTALKIMSETLNTALRLAKEHRQNIKEKSYKSQRELELAAKRVADSVRSANNYWRLLLADLESLKE